MGQPDREIMPDFETCPPAARKRYDTVSMFFLGMVNVGVSETRISVRWSVNDFDSRSLDAVIAFLLRQSEPKPVLIEYHFGGWERRMVESPLGSGRDPGKRQAVEAHLADRQTLRSARWT